MWGDWGGCQKNNFLNPNFMLLPNVVYSAKAIICLQKDIYDYTGEKISVEVANFILNYAATLVEYMTLRRAPINKIHKHKTK